MDNKDFYTPQEIAEFARILIQLGISKHNFEKLHENKTEILRDANSLYNNLQLYKEKIPKNIQDKMDIDINSLEQECGGYY